MPNFHVKICWFCYIPVVPVHISVPCIGPAIFSLCYNSPSAVQRSIELSHFIHFSSWLLPLIRPRINRATIFFVRLNPPAGNETRQIFTNAQPVRTRLKAPSPHHCAAYTLVYFWSKRFNSTMLPRGNCFDDPYAETNTLMLSCT